MGVKRKLFSIAAVSLATLMFSLPSYAEQTSKKEETKQENTIKLPKQYSLSEKFNKEFDERFEAEARKENVWHDVLRVNISEQDSDTVNREPYLDYSNDVKRKVEKSAQRAAVDALELTLKETKIWDLVVERLKWLTKMEVIQNKNGDLNVKNPISEIKKSERDVEEKIEGKIDRLEKDIEIQKKANNLKEVERLENERNKMRNQLYSTRQFKTSFGFSLDYGDFNMKDFDAEAYSKFQSKHLEGKLSYHIKRNKFCLELDKEYAKDSHVKLENSYERSLRADENYELSSSLSISHKMSKNLSFSISQSHKWTYDQDVTSTGISKSLGKDTSVSISGSYDWTNKSSGVFLGLNINF